MALSTVSFACERYGSKHIRWEPKDGDLCLSKVKPGQTLVEARGDSDSATRSSDLSIAKKASIETSVKTKVAKEDFQDRSQVPFLQGSPPTLTDADNAKRSDSAPRLGTKKVVKGAPNTDIQGPSTAHLRLRKAGLVAHAYLLTISSTF